MSEISPPYETKPGVVTLASIRRPEPFMLVDDPLAYVSNLDKTGLEAPSESAVVHMRHQSACPWQPVLLR